MIYKQNFSSLYYCSYVWQSGEEELGFPRVLDQRTPFIMHHLLWVFHKTQLGASEPLKIFKLENSTWGRTNLYKIDLTVECKVDRKEESLGSGNTSQ